MSDDPHSPTTAGPTPETTPAVPAVPAATVVASSPAHTEVAATAPEQPPELPFGIPPDHPEILVGAAFAGGLVAAIILKRLGGD